MAKKVQSDRLTKQHEESKGVLGIFGEEAKHHDTSVGDVSKIAFKILEDRYPKLTFRYRKNILKEEINRFLNSIDKELGQTLFLDNPNIQPDGGIIEVKDDKGNWRVVLVSEAKHQGKDIENIKKGIKVGTKKDQDIMAAGNAIERSHKNISEIANFLLLESHFPYILFIEGSNFLTEDVIVESPDGRKVTLRYNDGMLNRIDRLTAANYGMPINKNLCENKFISHNDKMIMLQAASIYTHGDGKSWEAQEMLDIMLDIAKTSIKILSSDLFEQLTNDKEPEQSKTSIIMSKEEFFKEVSKNKGTEQSKTFTNISMKDLLKEALNGKELEQEKK